MKVRMFGQRLLEFVRSIDIVDQETFDDVMSLVAGYVHDHLDVLYFSVLEQGPVDQKTGLLTLYSTRDSRPWPSYTADGEGGYGSHSAYTFGEDKPIWVVSESRGPLVEADDCKDMWSGSEDLPAYSAKNRDVHTSVMHPLRRGGRPIGVLEFAATQYIEPTPASQQEVANLAQVLGHAYRMWDVGRDQRAATKSALQSLKHALQEEQWTRLALPRMFVAYSGTERLTEELRANHQAVIDVVREVVSEFDRYIEADFWEDITEAGNVNEQVIKNICSADFGLAYFSEPSAAAERRFADNSNVLFEAGMMQALNNSSGTRLAGWLAVREAEDASTKVPFDIAAERMVIVPRADDGSLDSAKFAEQLRAHIEALVDVGER